MFSNKFNSLLVIMCFLGHLVCAEFIQVFCVAVEAPLDEVPFLKR